MSDRALSGSPSEAGSLTDLLIGILEFKDPFFRGSSSLTRLLCIEIGREMDLPEDEVQAIALAALLRDLGRVVQDNVLGEKISVVGDEEVRRRGQAQIGLTMALLNGVDVPDTTREAIQYHHERFDGSGYPEGRHGEDIPLGARILSVAESFAAIIAPRPHRPPRRIDEAMEELQVNGGRQLDPVVIHALRRVLGPGDPHALRFGLRHHVLIVHPDAHRATSVAVRLCSHGYLGEAVSDLATARERLKRVPIEAVVLSAALDGVELRAFLAEIRGSRYSEALPTIVVDADESGARAGLLDAGADLCFPSGTGLDEIRASLGALIGRIVRTRAHSREDVRPIPYAPWHALQGELKEFSLPWLLQMLRYEGRTAGVLVRHQHEDGVIYLARGEPQHAVTGGIKGRDALRKMLTWREGDFVVQPEVPAPEQTIDGSLMKLLLDEAVIEDHASTMFGAIP